MTPEPYTTGKVTLGHVKQQEIDVAYIPREDYLRLVRETIEDARIQYDVDLTEQLMPVAETMDRFPLGAWIHDDRGCGCLVGEFLVAHDQVDRMKYVTTYGGYVDANGHSVEELLANEYPVATANALERVGLDIDSRLGRFCRSRACYYLDETDEWGEQKNVDSIIFID